MRVIFRLFLIGILLIALGMIGTRVVFDIHLYRSGRTLVVRKTTPDGYDYLLHIPKGYHDFAGPMSLLIFLHGAGEVGTDPNTLKNKDAFHFAHEAGIALPCIGVTPICRNKRWEPYRVAALLDQVFAETRHRFRIDPGRVYLTGYSMGGFGTIETAMEYPDRFAAIVPVAGGGEPNRAEKLKNIPTWFFHGENDKTVPLPSSSLLVDAMKQDGHGDVRLTVLEGAGHGIAKQVYSDPKLYDWLLCKRKKQDTLLDDRP